MGKLIIALLILATAGTVQAQTIRVTATAYCFSRNNHTASGEHPTEKTIGISRDIKRKYKIKWGQRVWINGVGYRIVNDLMAAKWVNRIDIWLPTIRQCRKFGRRSTTIILCPDKHSVRYKR